MASPKLLPLAMILGCVPIVLAQSPTYGLGRTPSAQEISAWDISISPTGKELPPGHGTAKEGEQLFKTKGCAGCHGADGIGARAALFGRGLAAAAEAPLDIVDHHGLELGGDRRPP